MSDDGGPGVPEALPRVVRGIAERVGVDRIDRFWVFPPLIRGRREWGLVAVSRYAGDRRRLLTAPYEAERNGRGLYMRWTLEEQGEAPPDRLPRVMAGVVQRSRDQLGDPREIEIGGDRDRYDRFASEYPHELFLEEAKPLEEAAP